MDSSAIAPRASALSLRLADMAIILAVVVPTLLAYNVPPSSTFLNQAAAFIGWGGVVVALAGQVQWPSLAMRREMALLLVPLVVLAMAALESIGRHGLPLALGLSAIGGIAAASLVVVAGAAVRQSRFSQDIFRGFCIALVLAGVFGAAIASIQVFEPSWADGTRIAMPLESGRAASNLRQPNHLSSLLVWSLVALAWLWQSRTLPATACIALGAFFVFGIVLTGSRTGLVDFLVIALWGVLDRRLPRGLRWSMLMTPLLYGVLWWGVAQWAQSTHSVFGGGARLNTEGDISSSRYAIWADTFSLIAQHRWFGVGFGEFNFAWSLTPFPHRPVAFFDHTHNLALQFAVELGIPMATVLMLSLLGAVGMAVKACLTVAPPTASMVRAALVIVITIGVHSMFEYPLWYSYFLLPTAFAFGFCLGRDEPQSLASSPLSGKPSGGSVAIALLGLTLLIGGVGSIIDYWRVVAIFDSEDGEPLVERIAEGQRSVFFKYHADYAAVTTAAHPSSVMPAFDSAAHNLLDTRLMIAWAKAFAERGDLERARHIAARLREFRNEDAKSFFAACDSAQPVPEKRPFQCDKPKQALDFRDFR